MKYLKELEKLNLPKNQYVIFGSGPLAIRGIRENEDIDLIVTKKLWDELLKNTKIIKKSEKELTIGNIQIFKSWQLIEESVKELINDSEMIKGFPFVKLEYVLKWKSNE